MNLLDSVSDTDLRAELERRRQAEEAARPPPDPSIPAFRVTLDVLALNRDVKTVADVIATFENLRYPEFVSVAEVKQRDLPSWSDDHPMNQNATSHAAYEEWFKDVIPAWSRGDD